MERAELTGNATRFANIEAKDTRAKRRKALISILRDARRGSRIYVQNYTVGRGAE